MKVERIYTPNVVGVARADTVQEAAATMRRFHVGSLLVVEGQRRPEVVGIVTDRDLVLLSLAEGVNVHKSTVDTAMSPVVATVSEDSDVLDALERMRAAGVRRLLVTKANGDPAGILSIDDIVDGLAAELAKAAALMKQEVGREKAAFSAGRAAA